MKLLKRAALASIILSIFIAPSMAYAATSPGLGMANTFSILSGTYSNTAAGTTINGDVGYTTGPAVKPTISGNTHVADSTYNQAGIDQGTALSALNSQACTFSFAPGAIDLATDTTHGAIGVYSPGVYCISGAASVGTAGITLTGSGTFIFRMTGALTTAANSAVTVAGGASDCTLWWTPGAATTLGANSTFAGTDIDASGITIGSTIGWTGRALAFGGTVSTNVDTINTTPACAAASKKTTTTTTTPAGTSTSTKSGSTPGLPDTGLAPQAKSGISPWWSLLAVPAVSMAIYVIRKRSVRQLSARQK